MMIRIVRSSGLDAPHLIKVKIEICNFGLSVRLHCQSHCMCKGIMQGMGTIESSIHGRWKVAGL